MKRIMEQTADISGKYKNILLNVLILAGLYLISLYSYLLFHSLAEIFSIIVAFGIFAIAWNLRQIMDNNYFLSSAAPFYLLAGWI